LCDIHGEYLFSTPDLPEEKKCCGSFFDPHPFFVNTGTCFTSNKEVWEKWPFTFSFVKIWLNVQSNISPGSSFTNALNLQAQYFSTSLKKIDTQDVLNFDL
jgi:hypothetical protein